VTAPAGAVIASTIASAVNSVVHFWLLLIVDAAEIVAVQLAAMDVGGVQVACSGFVVLWTSVPQANCVTESARVLVCLRLDPVRIDDAGAEARLHVTESFAPGASLPSVAVSVTAVAPSPNVVVEPLLELAVTVIASAVSTTVEIFDVLLTDVAVMVAVQLVSRVAAAGAV
jgi:hypothetical protein